MSASTAATMRGRRKADSKMSDTCTISEPDTDGALNESTGRYTSVAGAQVYSGPCRVRPQQVSDRVVEAGERPVSLRTYVVSVPVSATNYTVDQVVRVTASALDPALTGTRMRVIDVAKGTHLTARRLVCEEQL